MAVKSVTKKASTLKSPTKKTNMKKVAMKKVSDKCEYTNDIYKVVPLVFGTGYMLVDKNNLPINKVVGIAKTKMESAHKENKAIRGYINSSGKLSYKLVEMDVYRQAVATNESIMKSVTEEFETHEQLKNFIHTESTSLKPEGLFIEPLKWKYLVRSAVRGKNIMMTGPTGCGKTLAAQSLVRSLKRPDFYFNLGATQDPRATLIGNTHFNKQTGTFFSESAFVKAIKTPNAIILLDEISRAHPEAWNILMTVLDQNQRYLRLDEAEGSPIVEVASGVTFIATANIGNEYTSTRIMDRAIMDRFVTIEMDLLDKDSEYKLLKYIFPQADDYSLNALSEIAHVTREMVKTDTSKVSTVVSSRVTVEAAGLIYDGFTLIEAAEIAILPYFSNDGGLDSERTFMKQLIQKYNTADAKDSEDKLFTDVNAVDVDTTQVVW